MTAQSDFVASPEEFMKRNIVVCQFRDGSRAPADSRPLVITIREWANRRCSKPGGKVYHLSSNVTGLSRDEKLPIYWLAYSENTFTQGVLTNASRYMFTALMNGCTLGFGSQTGDGACLISHANARSTGTGGRVAEQRAAQQLQLEQRFGGSDFNMVEPASYMNTSDGGRGFIATNFGKNVNGTWQFFTHRYMDSGGTGGVMLHGGIYPAVATAPV